MRRARSSAVVGLGVVSALVSATSPGRAQDTVTTLLRSGDDGRKRNLVIIGDGFQTGADQTTFDNYVDQTVIQRVFGEGPLREDMNAFNIFRVNAISQDSGVTQIDANGNVTTARTTALDYRFSGMWNRCWMEAGPNTETNLNNILDKLVPQRDLVFVVLNEAGFGGCRNGDRLAVTTGANWTVGAHEMGHMIGNLCDEYFDLANPLNYTGTEPGCVNLTTNIARDQLKWRDFVNPLTPLPTAFNATSMNAAETAGAFVGGTLGQSQYTGGLWRATDNGRMNSNTPAFGPVDYNRMKEVLDDFHDFTYAETYVGDFNGDGLTDVVIHNANSLALFLAGGTVEKTTLTPAWIQTMPMPVWDSFAQNDRFYVGDFDGDGMDDLYVVNLQDFAIPYLGMLRATGSGFEGVARYDLKLPGWDDMRAHDRFYVADLDGDKRKDLVVFNAEDWSMGYLGMLRSTGSGLFMAHRYDDILPGWDRMLRGDQLYVADFDADRKQDLFIFNAVDWRFGYLISLRSDGDDLIPIARYDDTLPGWDRMLQGDRFYVADFDGDGDDDLYVFNGPDWSMSYLEKLVSQRGSLSAGRRWDGEVPGWDKLMPHDQFFVADINGDGSKDLYAYNALDWDSEYLGVLLSRGDWELQGSWQKDWIGSWNLGKNDRFLVGNFNGGQGWQDLFVFNDDWFGLLRSHARAVALNSIYPRWIHEHEYHALGWW